jgi:EAL domain-containing protein (putative c-di-GMP-specific phosphodiesterase class I)
LSGGHQANITVSVGVAEYPEAAANVLELINCAEIVMFRCKGMGKNTIQYFDTPILNDFLNNIEMENKLKEAVFRSNFQLYYQPQYYTGSKKLRGVEALIRWKDESRDMISPNIFIPIAEKNGCIIPIGSWVLEQSIKQFAQWRNQYGIPFVVSINISSVQFARENFVDALVTAVSMYKVKPSEVEIEITESVLIEDFDKVFEKLKILKDYGIRVSLDDFGTGFSSLSYLKKLPIDTLKIDKSFIDTVLADGATRIITESIINMVKSLGIESIAEGVEDDAQYNYLHAIGCDVIQGYLLGKPQPAEEIDSLLKKIL